MTTNPKPPIQIEPAPSVIRLLILASFLLAVAVLLGAFGAHGLSTSGKALEWWQTATLYLFVHTLGMLLIGILGLFRLCGVRAAYCLGLGSLLFCGTLYAMALGAPRWLGAITPIGGSLFVLGWLWLTFELIRHQKT